MGPLPCSPVNFNHNLLKQGTSTADHLTLLRLLGRKSAFSDLKSAFLNLLFGQQPQMGQSLIEHRRTFVYLFVCLFFCLFVHSFIRLSVCPPRPLAFTDLKSAVSGQACNLPSHYLSGLKSLLSGLESALSGLKSALSALNLSFQAFNLPS